MQFYVLTTCSSQNCVFEPMSTFHVQLGVNVHFPPFTSVGEKTVDFGQNLHFRFTLALMCIFKSKIDLSPEVCLRCADPTLYSLQFAATETVFLNQNLHFTSNLAKMVPFQVLTSCENYDFESKSLFHI